MVARQAILDYRTTGARAATSEVVSLADALRRQKEHADRLAPALRQVGQAGGAVGAISQSAVAKLTSLTNTFGPAGAGLSYIARQGPIAAMGVLQYASAAEKASLVLIERDQVSLPRRYRVQVQSRGRVAVDSPQAGVGIGSRRQGYEARKSSRENTGYRCRGSPA